METVFMAKNDLVSLAIIYNAPIHAYAINAIVRETEIEKWAKISPASIYNALNRLQKEQCVNVSLEKVGNMPERKVYAITTQGKERLKKELSEALLSLEIGEFLFYVAVTFGFGMKADDIIALLKRRIEELRNAITKMNGKYKFLEERNIRNSMITVHAGIKHMQVEIETAQDLIALLEKEPEFYEKLAEDFRKIHIRRDNRENGDK